MRGLTARLADAALIARAVAEDPVESLLNVQARIAERDELRGKRTRGAGFMPWPPCPYEADEDAEQKLHELVGAPWPCPLTDQFWQIWSETIAPLEERGLKLGRGSFAGWGDGEPGLVRAVWCLTHHLRPKTVVETGVARGITTRFILEALDQSDGGGHLWSVDLPPPRSRELRAQVGIAVPDRLRAHWTYIKGSSRRRLPGLLARLRSIDLFIHDSRHSERNLLFELNHAWDALRVGGALVADDVDLNCGFHAFRAGHPDAPAVVAHAEPLRPDRGRQDDLGVFGLVRKPG